MAAENMVKSMWQSGEWQTARAWIKTQGKGTQGNKPWQAWA